MKIGFTGTREGMSQWQKELLVLALFELKPTEFHHGDCAGADSEAHDIVREFFPEVRIVVHPPKSDYLRAYKTGDHTMPQDDYIPRDERIVDMTDYLIGAPRVTDYEEKRSGSWYTVRYARRRHKPHRVLSRNEKS